MSDQTSTQLPPQQRRQNDHQTAAPFLPAWYRRWHLYGAGLENVGDPEQHQAETLPLPQPGPDEILVRHDACGICYSDIKIIALGRTTPVCRAAI
jgi:hypothetical protein